MGFEGFCKMFMCQCVCKNAIRVDMLRGALKGACRASLCRELDSACDRRRQIEVIRRVLEFGHLDPEGGRSASKHRVGSGSKSV